MVESTVADIIKQYIALLTSMGIHSRKVILFGSYATGRAGKWSDIDLIVIAPEFDGRRDFSLIESLWLARKIDSRIEPIPCGEKEWETDQSRPILEIARREGMVISN